VQTEGGRGTGSKAAIREVLRKHYEFPLCQLSEDVQLSHWPVLYTGFSALDSVLSSRASLSGWLMYKRFASLVGVATARRDPCNNVSVPFPSPASLGAGTGDEGPASPPRLP
jgi:hypothetical protein